MAVSCVLECVGTIGLSGEIRIDWSVAVVTFSMAEPLIAPEVAVIVTVPVLIPLTRPDVFTTARAPSEDVHTTCDVRSCVLLSEKTPVAVNCALPLTPTTVVAGVTTILVRTAGVIVREAVADIEL